MLILSSLIQSWTFSTNDIASLTKENYDYLPSQRTIESAFKSINGLFLKQQDQDKFQIRMLVEESTGKYKPTKALTQALENHTFRTFLSDAIDYGISYFTSKFSSQKFVDGLILYEKYSRKDVCRILNWDKDDSSTVYGYRIKNNTCPIFVTYNKKEEISGSTKYEDMFLNSHQFSWMTRNRINLNSSEVIKLKAHKETTLRISLFIKKHDGEGCDFYYIGDMQPYDFSQKTIKNDKNQELPIVNVKFSLLQPVEERLYQYLTQ